jgi:hypothetical protein
MLQKQWCQDCEDLSIMIYFKSTSFNGFEDLMNRVLKASQSGSMELILGNKKYKINHSNIWDEDELINIDAVRHQYNLVVKPDTVPLYSSVCY